VVIPPYGEGSRVMGEDESPPASSSTPRQQSVRKKRG
jgi:hypothetical protein